MSRIPKHAPTLYMIIGLKTVKATLALLVAFGLYTLRDQDLPEVLQKVLLYAHLDPARHMFVQLADKLDSVTPVHMTHAAIGAICYAIMLFVQAVGLLFEVTWIYWFVIAEAGLLVPLEVFELAKGFSFIKILILLTNVGIVWYLYVNRARLTYHGQKPKN